MVMPSAGRAAPEKLSPDDLTTRLADLSLPVHYGGVMIPAGQSRAGPIIVIAGALDVQDGGRLEGDAWVINGQVILTGSARVNGSLDLVNSETFQSRHARIEGEIRRYRCACRLDGEAYDRDRSLVFIEEKDPRAVRTEVDVGSVAENRVDFCTVKLGVKRGNPRHRRPHTRASAHVHVPFRRNDRGYLGFDADLAVPIAGERADLIVRGFKETATSDDWQLSRRENSWVLLLGGTDLFDYYERQGGALGTILRPREDWTVETSIGCQRDRSLHKTGSPSIFHSRRSLPENPEVDEGTRLLWTSSITWDTRCDRERPAGAWFLQGRLEKGFDGGPGEFDYLAFSADLRRYTNLPGGVRWAQRCYLFSGCDPLPRQASVSLNGYAGIRGLEDRPFSPFRGDRLALASTEVRIGLPDLPVLRWIFNRADLLAFADIGRVVTATNPQAPLAFLDAGARAYRKTAGLGLTGSSYLPYVGIYVAQDLDGRRDGPRVILRAERSF